MVKMKRPTSQSTISLYRGVPTFQPVSPLLTTPDEYIFTHLKLKSGYGAFLWPITNVIKNQGDHFKDGKLLNFKGDILLESPPEGIEIPLHPDFKAFDSTLNGKTIIVYRNGFVGLQAENSEVASRVLNTIFGVARLSGLIRCSVVKMQDLVKIGVNQELTITFLRSPPLDILPYIAPLMSQPMHAMPSAQILEQEFKDVIQKAEIVVKDENLSENLLFFIEGATHHFNREFSQSFIMNWIVIERHLYEMWQALLKENGITGDQKKPNGLAREHNIRDAECT
jgi:hypothetical protein